jgi:hypothetical protein
VFCSWTMAQWEPFMLGAGLVLTVVFLIAGLAVTPFMGAPPAPKPPPIPEWKP